MPFEPAPKTEEQQRVQMGRIALEAIAAHILTVPPKKFYLGCWNLCGTAACAIGHSYKLPEVTACGLQSTPTEYQHEPMFGQSRGFVAVSEALTIPLDVAHHLFSATQYESDTDDITAPMVAFRIREYLAA